MWLRLRIFSSSVSFAANYLFISLGLCVQAIYLHAVWFAQCSWEHCSFWEVGSWWGVGSFTRPRVGDAHLLWFPWKKLAQSSGQTLVPPEPFGKQEQQAKSHTKISAWSDPLQTHSPGFSPILFLNFSCNCILFGVTPLTCQCSFWGCWKGRVEVGAFSRPLPIAVFHWHVSVPLS